MAVVALRPLDRPPTPDGYKYFDQVTFSPGSPPDRPHPPGGGGEGIWGPNDPRPTNPIAGFDPIHGTFPPGGPGGGGGGSSGPGLPATIIPLPPADPPVAPPAGMAPGAVQVVVWMGPGTKPTTGWVNPYADASPPVAPPA